MPFVYGADVQRNATTYIKITQILPNSHEFMQELQAIYEITEQFTYPHIRTDNYF